MTRGFLRGSLTVLLTFGVISSAFGHYLWVTIDSKTGENGTTNIYFEGGAGPGDGQYLDPFVERGSTWIRTLPDGKATKIEVADTKDEKKNKRWLSGKLPAGGPRSVESYGKWGVYRYGKTDVLLHYYAKNIEAESKSQVVKLGRAEQQALDIVPSQGERGLIFRVLWNGKPAAGRQVIVRGPGVKENPKTDRNGTIFFETAKKGRYVLRTSYEQKDKSGEDGGRKYDMIRHHATLLVTLPGE